MTQAKHTPGAAERIPDLQTAILCLRSLVNNHKFHPEEKLFKQDVMRSMGLLKSAPELLAALESLVRHQENIFKGGEISANLKPAYAAIAKARGEQS